MGWPENTSEWLGVGGFILLFLALVLSYCRHRWHVRLQREQRQESVSLEVSFERSGHFPTGTLSVGLVNTGHVAVYVDEVSLRWAPPKPSRRKLRKLVKKRGLLPLEGHIPLSAADQKPNPVAIGDRRVYCLLPEIPTQLLATALKCPASQVSIAAHSPSGEIGRISGGQVVLPIQRILKRRAQIADALAEQTAKGTNGPA